MTDAPILTGPHTNRRKLVAVVHADIVGYSRLIGLDDVGTLERVRALRRDVIDPAVTEHDGRIVNAAGDALLMVFDSVDGAVRCALKVQQKVSAFEANLNADRRISFRIGINIGDAIPDGTDLHGDVVNVAARLQAECPPGGICISRAVREHVSGRNDLTFQALGPLSLRNIDQPVEAFVLRPEALTVEKSVERTLVHGTGEALPLPDKPSIAVLAFTNMSGDAEQEYFADGVVEEIITGLSRVRSFFVIARNSSFAYKGKSTDVRQIGRELGVRYVLEGSVRKVANRVRITGQLVEASTGMHVWADRFDGTLEDIFEMQDRITASVVSAIGPNIHLAEIERVARKPPQSLLAYDLVLRALPLHYSYTREGHEEASRLLRRAMEIDPKYALAAVHLAICYHMPCQQGWVEARKPADESVRLNNVALEYGGEDPHVLAIAAYVVAFCEGDLRGAVALIEKALAMNPSSGHALTAAGQLYAFAGETERAIDYLKRAARHNPLGWQPVNYAMALAHFVAGRYGEAADFAGRVPSGIGSQHAHNIAVLVRLRAASLGLLGRIEEGRQALERLHRISPGMTIALTRTYYEIDMNHIFKTPGVVDALCEGLRLAGLSE
jgi:adenylate cyclase